MTFKKDAPSMQCLSVFLLTGLFFGGCRPYSSSSELESQARRRQQTAQQARQSTPVGVRKTTFSGVLGTGELFQSRYVLRDSRSGRIVAYVESTSLELAKHVGLSVRITGYSRYDNNLRLEIVTVTEIARPDEANSTPGDLSCDIRLVAVGTGTVKAIASSEGSRADLAKLAYDMGRKLAHAFSEKGKSVAVITLRNRKQRLLHDCGEIRKRSGGHRAQGRIRSPRSTGRGTGQSSMVRMVRRHHGGR